MKFVEVKLFCHKCCHLLLVASEHHGLGHAELLELRNGLCGVGLHFVGYDDVAGIIAVDGNVDYCAYMVGAFGADVRFCAHGVHQCLIAHAHRLAIDASAHALTGYFLHVGHRAAVVVGRISLAQGSSNGVGGVTLHMGCKVLQGFLVEHVGVHSVNGKHAACECAGLVEHHSLDFGESVHVVAALDENATARSTANSGKKCERNGDD